MSIASPRPGKSIGFHLYNVVERQGTIGEPRNVIWTSIKHICSRDVADHVLQSIHEIANSRIRKRIAYNLHIYINRSYELYQAAVESDVNISPLIYYYSFLHLAKAICEINSPSFHNTSESYRHGLSWRPDPNYLVSIYSDTFNISSRGIWHILWESLTNTNCKTANPQAVYIRDLFALCPDIDAEYEMSFGRPSNLIHLIEPDFIENEDNNTIWLRFSVLKDALKARNISKNTFLEKELNRKSRFHLVHSDDNNLWTFEHEKPFKIDKRREKPIFYIVDREINRLNIWVYPSIDEDLDYYFPIQSKLPIFMPQIIVYYSILFWIGSLVRYDPHSMEELQESSDWLLISGFMNQGIIWLLELIEWYFYRTETTLKIIR